MLVSGSFNVLVNAVADDLGIALRKANTLLEFDDHGAFHAIHTSGDAKVAKLKHLERFCEELGINITECACIGDGANDEAVFAATGHGITFKGSELENQAWKTIGTLHDIQTIL